MLERSCEEKYAARLKNTGEKIEKHDKENAKVTSKKR